MKLYEIDQAIEALVDPETGAITDYEAFDALVMEKDEKIEYLLLYKKDLDAEAEAIAAEIEKLGKRKTACENKSESLKQFAAMVLNGEKFKTPRVSVTYRKSRALNVDEAMFLDWATSDPDGGRFLKYAEPTLSKTAIKEAIENGEEVRFATITEKTNIIIN